MFVWLQNLFNIQDSDRKRDVFESQIRKRFTDWRSELRCKYITGTYKQGSKKKGAKDDEGGQKYDERPPYVIYPHITKEDWEEFVKQNSHPTVLVSVYIVVVFPSFDMYVFIYEMYLHMVL